MTLLILSCFLCIFFILLWSSYFVNSKLTLNSLISFHLFFFISCWGFLISFNVISKFPLINLLIFSCWLATLLFKSSVLSELRTNEKVINVIGKPLAFAVFFRFLIGMSLWVNFPRCLPKKLMYLFCLSRVLN